MFDVTIGLQSAPSTASIDSFVDDNFLSDDHTLSLILFSLSAYALEIKQEEEDDEVEEEGEGGGGGGGEGGGGGGGGGIASNLCLLIVCSSISL